jgi:hypothetical protein
VAGKKNFLEKAGGMMSFRYTAVDKNTTKRTLVRVDCIESDWKRLGSTECDFQVTKIWRIF